MRPQNYTFEQRKEWREAYLKGEHVPTPLGARRATFIRELRDWARKCKRFGPDSIDPSAKRKDSPIAVILAAASLVASDEMSTKEAARQFGVKDMFTGEIISYDLSLHPNMAQITRMLKSAFDAHPDLRGLIFPSDQGWQYMNKKYASKLAAKGISQSMSRKGNCYDNSIMESFFGVMKNEMYYGLEDTYKSFSEFKKAVDEYIVWHNKERIREGCGYKSPIFFRAEWTKSRQTIQ